MPVDCSPDADRPPHVNSTESSECGSLPPASAVEAMCQNQPRIVDDRQFFVTVLPRPHGALTDRGGAATIGKIGVATELVTGGG
jgi:hypothetical protein